jgi:ABC-type branched-subunit amino acid transport system permease subunit
MGIQYPTLFGVKISKIYYLLMCLEFVGLSVLFNVLVSKSWLGLALEAIRENEEAAEASGINCAKFR